mmetsp:Transcript_113273/g.196441  ORF Transcript_113273/g.196441 Transcript_113273/m.196441 type:complete len:229 (+) Transcript_113273:152-838(+)
MGSQDALVRGGIKAAVKTMQEGERDAEVQEQACHQLVSLLKDSADPRKVKAAIVQEGGIEAITSGMNRHMNEFQMPEAGCRALSKLSEDSPEVKEELTEKGGIDIVLRVMLRYPGEYEVQESGTNILANIADKATADRRDVIATKGAAQVVMSAMLNHERLKSLGTKVLAAMDPHEVRVARETLCKEKGADRVEKPLQDIQNEVSQLNGSANSCCSCGFSFFDFGCGK